MKKLKLTLIFSLVVTPLAAFAYLDDFGVQVDVDRPCDRMTGVFVVKVREMKKSNQAIEAQEDINFGEATLVDSQKKLINSMEHYCSVLKALN